MSTCFASRAATSLTADLHRYLNRHTVVWVWEANDQQELVSEDNEPLVTEITIAERLQEPG